MRRKLMIVGGAAVLSLALATPALASPEWIVERMSGLLRPDVGWAQIRAQLMTAFYISNPDERGVTAAGIDNLRRIVAAQRRSQAMSQILAYDLDGDGAVTREEIVAVMQPRARQMIQANGVQLEPTPQQVRLQLDKLVADALKPDADRNGVITAQEILQEGQQQADQASKSWKQSTSSQYVPMTLDRDGDGAVSLAEYETAIREQFDMIDRDHDGVISAAEIADIAARLKDMRQTAQRAREMQAKRVRLEAAVAGCDVPPAPVGVRLVLLGANQGKALSKAWIGSQDQLTTVATVEIAPGPEPLILALASGRSMIWDLVGATERIAGIVAHGEATLEKAAQQRVASNDAAAAPGNGRPLVGVIGVPREKIRFTAHTGCLVPATETSMKDNSAQESAALLLGRAADEIGGEHSAGTYRIPATRHFADRPVRNAIQLPQPGRGELLWKEVQQDYPAGIAQIDPATVVSAHQAGAYTVLPGGAGLAELVDTGALRITAKSHGFRIINGNYEPFTWPEKFRITEKLRIPAGATGTFTLPSDVPRPDGDLSEICVLSESDMKPIRGSTGPCH
ncbi:EF-hand domain-containing protein [Bradyrhizobium sp. USDA 4353]